MCFFIVCIIRLGHTKLILRFASPLCSKTYPPVLKRPKSREKKPTLLQVQYCHSYIMFFPLTKYLKTFQVLILYCFYFHPRHPKRTLPRTLNEESIWYGLITCRHNQWQLRLLVTFEVFITQYYTVLDNHQERSLSNCCLSKIIIRPKTRLCIGQRSEKSLVGKWSSFCTLLFRCQNW